MLRRTAPANKGLILAACYYGQEEKKKSHCTARTSGSILREIKSLSPPAGYTSLYVGASDFCTKVAKALAIPSVQRRSYLKSHQLHKCGFLWKKPAYLLGLLFSIASRD